MTDAWEPITKDAPPQGTVVFTKIDGVGGPRNEQKLVRKGHLWFFSDMSMYVYYTPTHYKKEKSNDRTNRCGDSWACCDRERGVSGR